MLNIGTRQAAEQGLASKVSRLHMPDPGSPDRLRRHRELDALAIREEHGLWAGFEMYVEARAANTVRHMAWLTLMAWITICFFFSAQIMEMQCSDLEKRRTCPLAVSQNKSDNDM